MHANCILDILYKHITFNLYIFILLPILNTCIQFGLLLQCIPSWHLNWWSRYVLYNLIANHVHVLYSKNSLVQLCVLNNSKDGLSLHVVSAVQDNCVDSKLLKLACEDRLPIHELAGECFL